MRFTDRNESMHTRNGLCVAMRPFPNALGPRFRLGQAASRNEGRVVVFGILAIALIFFAGCTRKFYRIDADREVEEVISGKNCSDAWRVENFFIYPHPLARFADPTNPDRPPMPCDDPGARQLSPNPQSSPKGLPPREGTGYCDLLAKWDAENRAEAADKKAATPEIQQTQFQPTISGEEAKYEVGLRTHEQPFRIKLEQATELGLINSREFQDKREDLYVFALPVTLQRFAF